MIAIHARRLASVRPDLAACFLEVAQDFVEAFPGSRLTPAQGYRTPIQQQAAAADGRSNADGRTSFSKHQTYPSMALDFAVLDRDGRYVFDGSDPRYRWVGEQFERHGFKWGGRFVSRQPDWDHVEVAEPGPSGALDAFALYQQAIANAPFLAV